MATAAVEARSDARGKWIIVTVIGVIVAMVFGAQGPLGGFWGAQSGEELGLSSGLMGAFVGYALIEAVGFGLGIAWLAFGRPTLRPGALGTVAYLSLGWALVSWFPHGALHQGLDEHDYAGLIRLEYGFHATMLLAAALLAVYFVRDRTAR